MFTQFRDRSDAGRQLAKQLKHYAACGDVLVLALPRGGVPVGFEVAQALACDLDVWIVRKLGVPGEPELAMGAIAPGGTLVLNEKVVREWSVRSDVINAVIRRERAELQRREREYRGNRPIAPIQGRTVILVDDGLATGATMSAAVRALAQHQPGRIVVAVPVASEQARESILRDADEVVCVVASDDLNSIGAWYEDFTQTSDEQVRELLERASTPAWAGPQAVRSQDPQTFRTTEIRPRTWGAFLESFVSEHRAWHSSIETSGRKAAGSDVGQELPLLGMKVDYRESRPHWILVTLGASPDAALTHIIPTPTRIRLAQTGLGEDKALEFESEDGTRTVLLLRRTALPEILDGISKAELVEG